MGYSLRYKSGKDVYIVPLHDRINNIELMESELENFDILTATYKSQDEFITKMVKLGRIEHNPTNDLYLLHSRRDAVPKKLIFNSKLILAAALDIYKQRHAGIKKAKVQLSVTNEMELLLDQIIEYANDPKWSSRICKSRAVPYKIRTELSDYVKINTKTKKTPGDLIELDSIKDQLLIYLRNYDILRETVLYCNYIKEAIKKREDQKIKGQYNLENYQQEISYEEQIKSDYLKEFEENKKELKQLSDELKSKRDAQYKEIEDSELSYWYSIGGTDAILANVDIDKIYSASTSDKEACGIIEPRKK